SGRRNLANRMIPLLGDVNVAHAVGGDAFRIKKPRGTAHAVIGTHLERTAGERRHYSGRSDFSDGLILRIRHINDTVSPYRNARGEIETSSRPGAVVSPHQSGSPGKSGHCARGGNFANRV